jgi:2'-5' RNA ligase
MQSRASPLILTFKLEQLAFERLDALWRAHFPPERNVIPAHLTLFYALPGEHEAAIRETLRSLCATPPVLPLRFPSLRILARGVAVEVETPELIALRRRLASLWSGWLGAQDRQGYRPHITVQNKVAAEQARKLYAVLTADWQPFEAAGERLLLWRYLGGPWELVDEQRFLGGRAPELYVS